MCVFHPCMGYDTGVSSGCVTIIIKNFPYYLEFNGVDFETYISSYICIVRPLWDGHDISFDTVSERHAATIYLCEPFQDPAASWDFQKLAEALYGPQREVSGGLNLVTADGGSSSLVCAS